MAAGDSSKGDLQPVLQTQNNSVDGALSSKPEHGERIKEEIASALDELKERGVTSTFGETQESAGELFIKFAKGTNAQTIKIKRFDWTKPGVVRSTVLEHLEL